jgi:hypothetical protein
LIDKTPGIANHRRDQAAAWAEPGESCSRCGVRADVDCPHRPGVGRPPAAIREAGEPPKAKCGPKPVNGGGHYRAFPSLMGANFRRKRDGQ